MEIKEEEKEKRLYKIFKTSKEEAFKIFEEMPVAEIIDFFYDLENEEILEIIKMFNSETQGDIVTELGEDIQLWIFENLPIEEFAIIFKNMSSDIRADLYQCLEKDKQSKLLPFLDKITRENVINLSSYHPETAGGIMVTDFATIIENMNVKQALKKIRKDSPSKKMIYYIYVVDSNMKLIGFVTLKDLIMAELDQSISEIIHDSYIYADADEDRESVAKKIEKYDLIAIPVINSIGQLLGIVTHDDAIEVIRAEQTEDMEKIMGIKHINEGLGYLETTSFQHFKKRIIWLVILAIVGIISGMIIQSFETILENLIILALYMPMLTGTGGNIGSQSATVVIRALSLGQVKLKDWFWIIFKEIKIAFLLSFILGMIAFGKIMFLSYDTTVPPEYSLFMVAFVISFALSIQVITSSIIGSSLPIIVKSLGGDPAVAASPAISTIVDVTGLLIYFSIATLILNI